MIKYVFIVFSIFFFALPSFAQYEEDEEEVDYGIINVGAGSGVTAFKGDVGTGENSEFFNNFRSGINLSLEKRVSKYLGFGLSGTFGKFAQNEQRIDRNLNFETKFTQIGLNVLGYLDTKSTTTFSPFLGVGVSFLLFNPFSDLKAADGSDYHYWTDGTIRNLPEFDESGKKIDKNKTESILLNRDYTYETALDLSADSAKSSYAKNAIAIPITFGLKFKLTENLETRFTSTYALTLTDYLDGYKGNGDNDSYIYAQMSFNYTFKKKVVNKADKPFENVDFNSLFKEDGDSDGVEDSKDKCPNSPGGIPVDKNGCPLDEDLDGVPDYMDREPRTPVTAVVNRYGETLTDEDIRKLRLMRDSVFAERITKFNESPSLETLKEMDVEISEYQSTKISSSIPQKFRFADLDGNGIIASTEVTRVIDGFFEGEFDITVATIMDIIDYFFEQ